MQRSYVRQILRRKYTCVYSNVDIKTKWRKIELFLPTPCQLLAFFLLCRWLAFREFVCGYTRWCPLLKLYISCNPHSQSIFLPRVSIPCLEPIGADRGGISFLRKAEYNPWQQGPEPWDQAIHCMLLTKQIQCNKLQYLSHVQAYFARKCFGELPIHLHQFHLVAKSGRGWKTMMPDIKIPSNFALVLSRHHELLLWTCWNVWERELGFKKPPKIHLLQYTRPMRRILLRAATAPKSPHGKMQGHWLCRRSC